MPESQNPLSKAIFDHNLNFFTHSIFRAQMEETYPDLLQPYQCPQCNRLDSLYDLIRHFLKDERWKLEEVATWLKELGL